MAHSQPRAGSGRRGDTPHRRGRSWYVLSGGGRWRRRPLGAAGAGPEPDDSAGARSSSSVPTPHSRWMVAVTMPVAGRGRGRCPSQALGRRRRPPRQGLPQAPSSASTTWCCACATCPRRVDFYDRVLGCAVVRRRDDLGLAPARRPSMIDLVAVDGPLSGRRRRVLGVPKAAQSGPPVPARRALLTGHLWWRTLRVMAWFPRGPAARNFGSRGRGLSLYLSDPGGNVVDSRGRGRD